PMGLIDMTGTSYIELSVRAHGSTIQNELLVSRPFKTYFSSEKMFVTYDVDLTGVPEAFLVIPGLSTLAPIAWVMGAELHTPITDTIFLESLHRVRQSLQHLYPTIHWGGGVRAAAVVNSDETYRCGNEALLFTPALSFLAPL